MDPRLLKPVDNIMPRFNKVITDGFHQKEFENAVHTYDHSLRMIFKSIERRGVFFRGVSRVSPREYMEYLNKPTQPRVCEIHKETLYPVKLQFDYQDRSGKINPLPPVYTMLPYCDVYGDLYLRNTQYSAQIVMAERGLPVTKEEAIFVKVLGFKFKIGIEHFKYDRLFNETRNNLSRTQDINLPANRFYSPSEARKIKDPKTPIPLLAWYTFADMGFSKAMDLYGECEYEIGSPEVLADECPADQRWEIITRSRSPNHKRLGEFIPHDLAIAVRNKSDRRKELSIMGLQYACALLYVIDCMSSYFDLESVDNPDYWKLLIGRCSVKPGDSNDYIMRLMYEHFDSMNNDYLDEDTIKKFASQSIVVSNMFDLFNYIIANRSEIVQTSDRASGFHKEIASLEFVLDRLITAANQFKHDIKNNTELSQNKVTRFLTSNFKLKEIDNARTANLIQEATPTDNPFVDYMLGTMPQHKVYTSGVKGQGKKEFDTSDSAGFTHPSIPFVYSYQRVTKPAPDARGYLNPCIYLINDRVTALNPKDRELYDATDKRLKFREPTK